MEIFNVLATALPVYGQTFNVSLNWIGKLIRWLCEGVGVVGVGIILFSLILKLITLPFDVYQRISMRKQNIQMKANQEKMEKLQKQYANDKQTYNQKVMEMYKQNGISIFSSCLPMILSLVIFIVAINAFNAFAQYANVENYNTLVEAYNADVKKNCVVLDKDNYASFVDGGVEKDGSILYTVKDTNTENFVYYQFAVKTADNGAYAEKTVEEKVAYVQAVEKTYYVDEVRAKANAEIAAYLAAYEGELPTDGERIVAYMTSSAQDAVVEAYENDVKSKTSFGWIKNIWVTDASYKHPVLSDSEFKTEAQREKFEVNGNKVSYGDIQSYTNAYSEDVYKEVTKKLDGYQSSANGYFILIVLSIGTILLQQFVMMRSQKEQQKFSSVDGMGGNQQKMTMIIMTGMFAIFSFMYSSAFSIYLITSNLFSLGSTLIINQFVDKKVEKQTEEATLKRFKNPTLERIEKAKNAGKQSAEESKKKNK